MWCSRSLLYTRVIPNFHYRHPELVSGSHFPKFTIPLIIRRCPSAQIKSQTKKSPHALVKKNLRFSTLEPIPHPSLQVGLSVPIQKIARSHRARPIFLISPTIPHPSVPSQKKPLKTNASTFTLNGFHIYTIFVAVTRQITVHIAHLTTTQHSYLRTY